MTITIRKAIKEDCQRMMELVAELAIYEKAPHEITVSFDHFVESGFGEHPVWWAFVADWKMARVGALRDLPCITFVTATWKGQRMYLEDLLVTEQLRGMGVGKIIV